MYLYAVLRNETRSTVPRKVLQQAGPIAWLNAVPKYCRSAQMHVTDSITKVVFTTRHEIAAFVEALICSFCTARCFVIDFA